MMKGRYKDDAEEGEMEQQQQQQKKNAPRKQDDGRFQDCNEHLYQAFQELHGLAQDFEKPFDAPAILVVGHQTDGKSALVEALMGFQFNHVGGGTKTRRPITLHMKYNKDAVQPCCFLMTEDAGEQEVTLEELQEHIHHENARLEEEQRFWSKEIVVRIEYKYSPNLTIIDTPGLISAAPGKKNTALQQAANAVETMVTQKMMQQEYIILCLEDSSDWNNATTRRTVMQVDPTLSRTVLVSTKFDTRLPQFSTPSDVEAFLRAPGLANDVQMLGGSPFFTSVPSGRVGAQREAVFRSNDQFREAVAQREMQDITELEGKLQRKLDSHELSRLGVHQLRRFLEALLQQKYLECIPAIVPLLDREHRTAEQRLAASRKELEQLATDKLKEKGRGFRESFLSKLTLLLKGTVAAPSNRFGETLADEHLRGGAFMGADGKLLVQPGELPNCNMRLYGGAQFHRAMAEFRVGVGQMACPSVTREEIVNACGVDDIHDGVNYVRTACVIAVSKSKEIFEPLIHQLGCRLAHILRRIMPISMYLLQKDGQCLSGHDLLLRRISSSFQDFIEEVEGGCKHRCLEDLQSTTRFVTWSLHTKSTKALRSIMSKLQLPDVLRGGGGAAGGGCSRSAAAQGQQHQQGAGDTASATAGVMIDLLECTLWQRQLGTLSEETVAALVAQVFEGIRDFIVQAVELKFNCFFLMPLVDTFPQRLREQLEEAWEEDVEGVFDVKAVRAALEARLRSVEAEKQQVERLQRKFALIHSTLAQQATLQSAPPGVKQSDLTERMSLMSLADSVSLSSFSKLRLPRAPSGSMPPLASLSQGGAAAATAGDSGRDARGQRDGKALGSEGGAADGSLKSHSRSGSSAGMLEQGARQPGSASAAAGALAAGLSKLTGGASGAGDRGLIKSGRGDSGVSVRAHAVSLSTATLSGQ
uniref:Dynamin-type G domain-containing protein n=1 Tax=Tetradesmus obliquus TaxID=3088 RepID=A0A383VV88_TETOB|eukprot:jgi/Sobl393_1/8216/SZX69397.1